jgi:hypothetical protein
MTVWNVVDLVDKDSALLRQLIHDIAVMDDFTANVNWRAKCLERDLDDVDGANHTCAEAARFEQKNPLLIGRSLAMSAIGDRIKRSGSHTTIISICQEFKLVQGSLRPRSSSGALPGCALTSIRNGRSFPIRRLLPEVSSSSDGVLQPPERLGACELLRTDNGRRIFG